MKNWKNKLRRGFALFLALVMCVSLLQLTALAAEDLDGEAGFTGSVPEHEHNSEGWICTPYCATPEHTHTSDCYTMVNAEDEDASTPVTLPDEIPVEDGTSTEVDDKGNPYVKPEVGTAGEDGEFKPGLPEEDPEDGDLDDGFGVDSDEGGETGGTTTGETGGTTSEPTTQEGGETGGTTGEPTTQEGGEPATQPEEGGEPATQPEEGSTTGEPTTHENGETTVDDNDPPLAMVPMLTCGLEEHQHSAACANREGGGWHCVPDTNITINVPQERLAAGSIDLMEGVTATPARCGNWPVQIAVASVTTEDGTELEPDENNWLEVEGGVVYTVEYVAYVEAAMTMDADSEADTMTPPEGPLAQATREVEGEEINGVARIGDTVYDTLQDAINAVQDGETVELLTNVEENVTSENKSFTLDLRNHTIHSGKVGQNVVTILGGTVTIKDGIITGGDYGDRTNQDGKGLLTNNANVTLENCVITNNKGYGKNGTTPGYAQSNGGYGGGIYAYGGSLTLTGCTVSDNKASSEGGGVYGHNSTVTINGGTEVVSNTCGGGNVGGAGIAMNGGTLNIDGATISGNISTGNRRGMAMGLTGANVNVTIKNAELSSSYDSGDASLIYAQYGKGPINLNLENVDVVNKAGTNTLYAIYSAVAGTFTAKDCTFHDSNGSIYLTKVTEQSYENCQFLNIDASYRSACAPVYLAGSGSASFTNCTFTGNKGYNAGGIYNTTTGIVTIDGCLFNQNSATNSSSAGAIYAAPGSNTTVTGTVVKENTTSGTNSSGPAGGISVVGSYNKTVTFTMTSGAVYNNKSEKQSSSPANDFYVYSSAKANILAAKDMADGDKDFSNYTWSDLTRTVIKEELTRSGNWTANNTPEYVATVGETQYKTIDDAYEAARLQSRKTGENVTVNVVEGYVPLNTYWGVSQKEADGPYAPSVALHLNNTHVYGVGITNSFSVGAGSTLTLSGTGTLNKNIYMMGGTLNIDGNVVVSGSAFEFNKGPIYDNKTATTAININGNVDKVQIALYSGTVTVGENAHVGKLEAKMTTSSGQVMATNFVMNGQVDELTLNQATSKSTATLNGHTGTLTLGLGTEIYGARTFPTTTAGENFSVDKLSVAPSFSGATSFDEETGRTSDGLISIAALKDPAQPVADLILIHGGGKNVGSAEWTTSYNLSFNGKDYKFLTSVTSDEAGNVVLHKTVVNGNYVLLDGQNGSDSNDGLTLATPVKTFAKAKEILDDNPKIKAIHVLGTVTVSGTDTWELGEGQTLESFPTFNGELVNVPSGATLNLSNIIIDGKGISRTSPLIENRGTLNIGDGAVIKGGLNTVIYSPNNGQGIDGGAVYNSGTLNMTGGEISGNSARTGGGVFSKGTFNLSGGEISGNTSYGGRFEYSYGGSSKVHSAPAGGGVFLGGTGTMEMSGSATIANNTVNGVGGGIALGNETNAYTSYGGPKLIMTGGTIDGNSAVQGGGIFIQQQCQATITGGSITNNEATGSVSVATRVSFMYGGGGIYVNGIESKSNGKLTLNSVAITENTSDGHGGGIAGCPSSNVEVNVSDGGVVAGNTSNGTPYDIYVYRGIVSGPGSDWEHRGGKKYRLSKYMLGGELYNWTNIETGERVPMQDVYYYDVVGNGSFYSEADPAVIDRVAKSCAVTISGNHSVQGGGGIGTNGDVQIGKDPNLNDFFDVTVNKKWLDTDGTEITDPQKLVDLANHVGTVTVDLYRRVIGTEKWELVDSRTLEPGDDGFWELNRPFTKLLKVLNGQPLEYKAVEEISLTGAWSEVSGGVIQIATPPIRENSGEVEATGVLDENQVAAAENCFSAYTTSMNWLVGDRPMTQEEVDQITSFTVALVEAETGNEITRAVWNKPVTPPATDETADSGEPTTPDENGSMEASAIAYASAEDSTAPITLPDPVITISDDGKTVAVDYLVKGVKYDLVTYLNDKDGNPIKDENGKPVQISRTPVSDDGITSGQVSLGEMTNKLNPPSLTLVKTIAGASLAGKTFKFTISYTDVNGKEVTLEKEITVPAGQTSAELPIASSELEGAPFGREFTVTEDTGSWNPSWSVSNAATPDGKPVGGATATGTFSYGVNTVSFTNYVNEIPVSVHKTISVANNGERPASIPTFTFALKAIKGDPTGYVMPANTTITLTGSDFAAGLDANAPFGNIVFSKAGLYDFTVEETAAATENWTFDSRVWTIHVVVVDDDGTLTASKTMTASDGTTSDSAAEFTNTYTPPRPTTTSLEVVKVWNDSIPADQHNSVMVGLYSSAGLQEYVTLNAGNNWRHEWTGLAVNETWRVEEVSIPGYTSTQTRDGNTVTITNTPNPENPPTTPPGGGGRPTPPPVVTELPDPNVPGAPPEVIVEDEDVPQTYIRTWDPEEEEYVYVPEDEVPLADMTPETGDAADAAMWTALCLTSAAGLAALHLSKPRKKEEQN